VASFIGVVNEFVGEVRATGDDSTATVDTEIGEMSLASGNLTTGTRVGDQVAVVIRPESVSVSAMRPESDGDSNTWSGTLRAQMFRGSYRDYLVDVGSRQIRARGGSAGGRTAGRGVFDEGEAVFLTIPATAIRAIPINSGRGEANGEASADHVSSATDVPRSVEEIGGAGTVPD
jgi:ABC-type Fe3+/spermidine/putrescine transport system ATPase subunit